MFVDEIKEKLQLKEADLAYTVTILGGKNIVISGVKTVILSNSNEQIVKVKNCVLKVKGEGLSIVQMGGGDMFLKGEISGVEIEKISKKQSFAR